MGKLEDAAQGRLLGGERITGSWQGLSDGLNRATRNPGDALVWTTSGSAVVVAWQGGGLLAKAQAERFERADIMRVLEGDDPLPGIVGALERKNATHAMARAMGSTSTRPTLTLVTRRGDFSLFFKAKQRGELRAAYVAIGDLTRSAR